MRARRVRAHAGPRATAAVGRSPGGKDDDEGCNAGAADRRHARPVRRAGAGLRPREPLLRRGLGGARRARATCSPPSRPSSAAPGSRSTSTRSCAAARLRRTGDRAGHEHALLLDGRRRRPAEGRRRLVPLDPRAAPPTARCSARCTARPATTCPLLLAVASADRVDGGWEISGHKIFGSLTPVWTYGGFHAMDTSDPATRRRSCTASSAATPTGIQIIDTWDTLGMRATQSQDTVLDKAFVPDDLVALVCPAGLRRRRPVPGRRSSPGR